MAAGHPVRPVCGLEQPGAHEVEVRIERAAASPKNAP